jgi:hypothetical protein
MIRPERGLRAAADRIAQVPELPGISGLLRLEVGVRGCHTPHASRVAHSAIGGSAMQKTGQRREGVALLGGALAGATRRLVETDVGE